ncbi:MAG: hypothetical protein AAF355_04235 [Myxococcota bacterium]
MKVIDGIKEHLQQSGEWRIPTEHVEPNFRLNLYFVEASSSEYPDYIRKSQIHVTQCAAKELGDIQESLKTLSGQLKVNTNDSRCSDRSWLTLAQCLRERIKKLAFALRKLTKEYHDKSPSALSHLQFVWCEAQVLKIAFHKASRQDSLKAMQEALCSVGSSVREGCLDQFYAYAAEIEDAHEDLIVTFLVTSVAIGDLWDKGFKSANPGTAERRPRLCYGGIVPHVIAPFVPLSWAHALFRRFGRFRFAHDSPYLLNAPLGKELVRHWTELESIFQSVEPLYAHAFTARKQAVTAFSYDKLDDWHIERIKQISKEAKEGFSRAEARLDSILEEVAKLEDQYAAAREIQRMARGIDARRSYPLQAKTVVPAGALQPQRPISNDAPPSAHAVDSVKGGASALPPPVALHVAPTAAGPGPTSAAPGPPRKSKRKTRGPTTPSARPLLPQGSQCPGQRLCWGDENNRFWSSCGAVCTNRPLRYVDRVSDQILNKLSASRGQQDRVDGGVLPEATQRLVHTMDRVRHVTCPGSRGFTVFIKTDSEGRDHTVIAIGKHAHNNKTYKVFCWVGPDHIPKKTTITLR